MIGGYIGLEYSICKRNPTRILYPTLLEAPDNLIHVVYTYKRRSIAHDVFSLDDDKGK